MAKWMNFHLSKGKGPTGKSIMPTGTMDELYKPRTAMPNSSLSKFLQPAVPVTLSQDIYAMGWRRGYYRGEWTLSILIYIYAMGWRRGYYRGEWTFSTLIYIFSKAPPPPKKKKGGGGGHVCVWLVEC